MDLKYVSLGLNAAVKEVGVFILSQRKGFKEESVSSKSFNQLVSYVDKEAEQMLVDVLQQLVPEAGFLTEEKTRTDQTEGLIWIIDPLDGTTNFIHGLPVYSVSVALANGTDLLCAAVYEINHDELFYAVKNRGAFLNGEPIRVKQTSVLNDTLMATGFPYYDFADLSRYISVLTYLMRNTRGLRRMGSAAVDLAYVACGRFDGFFELGLSAWDVAAGALLVAEAGGKVTDFTGRENFIHGRSIVAASSAIHAQLGSLIKQEFGD
jgi:myo-inositol-1(or 4)-monophosphatase